jgi:hypothetical protein
MDQQMDLSLRITKAHDLRICVAQPTALLATARELLLATPPRCELLVAFCPEGYRSLAEPRFVHYTDVRFRVVHITLDMWLPFRVTGLSSLANCLPDVYEKYLAFTFPTMNIRAEFEVMKDT